MKEKKNQETKLFVANVREKNVNKLLFLCQY